MHIPLPRIRTAILLVLLGISLAFLVSSSIGLSSTPESSSLFRLKLSLLLGELSILLPLIIYLKKKKLPFFQLTRLHMVKPAVAITALIAGFAFIVILEEINVLIEYILPLPEWMDSMEGIFTSSSFSEFIIMFLAAVIIAAFTEECLFRGFLQQVLEKRLRDVTRAILYTGIFFALIHFNPYWVIQIYLFGVFLGYLTWRSGSILPAILVHMLNNYLSFLLSGSPETEKFLYLGRHVSPIFILPSFPLLYYSFRLFNRLAWKYRIVKSHKPLEESFHGKELTREDDENRVNE